METLLKQSFLLSKFVEKTEFPQFLPYLDFQFCYEPIVYLVQFFNELPKSSFNPSTFPQAFFKNADRIYIGENVEIDPCVYIEGPAWIGNHVKIKHGAYIRPYSFVDTKALVGHACEIKNSILCQEAKASHFNYVGDSLIGPSVNLGAGVKCANYKLNRGMIKLRSESDQLQTLLKKLGAIVGKEAAIGCNAVLSPGTLITPYTKIPPSTHVKGYI
jgi:NDP-sugar pyrophosphorylase family protein